MRVALLSPLPPSRTGIAHYASIILPALAGRFEVAAFDRIEGYDHEAFDLAIYQLGNNPHHEWIYREAMVHPGVAVLHDVVLHHLIVEMTLARGDLAGYVAALRASHGAAGEAWARGRAAGLHDEIANFLFPASIDLANRSSAVIVHNRWAADLLRSHGTVRPIHVVPHPADPVLALPAGARAALRERHGISADQRVIGFFGFLTSAKRSSIVIEAFARARTMNPRLRLLVVGEPAPNIDLDSLNAAGMVMTGYVPEAEFAAYYEASDRLINLRYPSAGETSGTLIRAFAAGKPVAVSDYAQFAEFPDACAVKIPLGDGEVDALARFFLGDLDDAGFARAQRSWLSAHASLASTIDGYAQAVGQALAPPGDSASSGVDRAIPLFPQLRVVGGRESSLTIENCGDVTLRSRLYGEPAYRVLAKLFSGDREIDDRWIELEGDLARGESATIAVPFHPGASLRLYHALEGVPTLDSEPWYDSAL